MKAFLTKIKVNKIFHLSDFTIEIDKQSMKHLIITGPNGSGKTVLINAIAEFLERIKNDSSLSFLNTKNLITNNPQESEIERLHWENQLKFYKTQYNDIFGKVELEFNDIAAMGRAYQSGEFLFAFYGATRNTQMSIPKNPTKPNLNKTGSIKEIKSQEFINFMVDLKVQEALARNEKLTAEADKITAWFDGFENLLREIFEDRELELKFNYKNYNFTINSSGKEFSFNELSDGYSAIIAIVSDMILKMQSPESLTRAYDKAGLVVIDEPDTHLSLGLQRLILPMLTRIFPKVQFIITTHSPFILSSLDNAVAFDLQNKERLEDLTEYSYEALAEGYFGVKTESSFLDMELQRFKELYQKPKQELTPSESLELENLDREIDAIADAVAPAVKAEYYQIKVQR